MVGTTTNISIRMDLKLKTQADALFNELGMNLSTAFNIFVRQSLREGRIPFDISLSGNPMFPENEKKDVTLSQSDLECLSKQDVLYEDVQQYCHDYQISHDGKAPSISTLQLAFGIGYGRAKRLLLKIKQTGDLVDDR